jgi:hypothetical protein
LHLAFGRVIRRRAPQERNIAARHGSAGSNGKKTYAPQGAQQQAWIAGERSP